MFQLKEISNLTLLFGQKECEDRLNKLIKEIIQIQPVKIYHYCGHNNLHASCLIQSMYSKNICIFSFDHGFSLALDNTCYDTYITKRPMDYEILSKHYKDKVIYIPCWNEDKSKENKYIPFKNHNKLISATGAARFYKLATNKYIELITDLLKTTNGKHIHYGPIDEASLTDIQNKLQEKNIPLENFIHIPWADNIAQSMIENNVDIFIEPFPIVSYKLTLEIHAAGIPTIIFKGNTRLTITDFIYDNPLTWQDSEEFIKRLSNIDAETLKEHSTLAREYYLKNHSIESLSSYFKEEKSIENIKKIAFYDSNIIDIRNTESILNIKPIWEIKKNQSKPKKLSPIEQVFSVTNTPNGKHKRITILGASIKIKRKVK